jgi:hypothetical protein
MVREGHAPMIHDASFLIKVSTLNRTEGDAIMQVSAYGGHPSSPFPARRPASKS